MILKLAFTDRMPTPQLLINSSLKQINFSLMPFCNNEIKISSIRHLTLFTHRTFKISFKIHKIKLPSDENTKTKTKLQQRIIFKSMLIQSFKIKISELRNQVLILKNHLYNIFHEEELHHHYLRKMSYL